MTLAEELVRAAAERMAEQHQEAAAASGLPPFLTANTLAPQAAVAVVAVLKRLSQECQTGVLWRFVDAAGFAHLAHQIEPAVQQGLQP